MKHFRRKRRKRPPYNSPINLLANKKSEILISKTYTIILAAYDQLIYTVKMDSNRNTKEVVSVTYRTKIGDDWEMVVYFDDVHGFLHRHRRVSLENNQKSTELPFGTNSTNHKRNLRYALNDIAKNFYFYRRHLLKASRPYLKKNSIDTHYD